MKESLEITTLNGDTYDFGGEWSRQDAIDLSFIEGQAKAEAEAEERELNWVRDLIENPKYREQAIKASREESNQERSNENDQ